MLQSTADLFSSQPVSQFNSHRHSLSWDYAAMDAVMVEASQLSGDDDMLPTSTPAPKSHKCSAPASSTTSASKRIKPLSSNADGLKSLSGAIDRFGEKFKEGTQRLAAAINMSPERSGRIQKARDILQEKEGWLTRCQRIELGNKFMEPRTADTYIYHSKLSSPDHKTWVAAELGLDDSFEDDHFFNN